MKAALAVALTTGSASAMAQFYFGGGAGVAQVQLDCAGTVSCDKRDNASKGFAGYMFKPWLGVEASYTDFGRARAGVDFGGSIVDVGLQPRAYGLFAIGAIPLGSRVTAFGKLGAAYVDSKATVAFGNVTVGDNDRTTTPAFGAGVSVKLTDGFEVRTEWERFRAEFVGEKGNVDFVSLSLRLSLPQK
jgi:OOP family OmpA-OmpF porin